MIAKFVITLIRGLWPYILREFLIALFRLLLFPLIKRLLFSRRNPPSIGESWFNRFRRRWYILVNGPLVTFVRRLFFKVPTRRTTRCATMATADPRRPSHMQLQSPLFRLPRELRDQIYGYCFVCETGLEYDYSKNKLTRTNGEHIDLSLMYTCREAAAELQGLALRLNKVNFRTACPGASRHNIGMFSEALSELNRQKSYRLNTIAHSCLTDETEAVIGLAYPQFAPVMRKWRLEGPTTQASWDYGEPPSVYRDFVHFVLRVLEDCPRSRLPFDLLSLPHLEPWQDPDDEALEEILGIAYAKTQRPRSLERDRCTVSAATCAIRFFNSLTVSIRSELRQVDLIEDRESISYPECHARGLIPFCQENKNLRIHRHIDLWWNVLWGWHKGRGTVPSLWISHSIATWIVEATALSFLGMPSESFRMTFESISAPEKGTEIFDVLQQDAAWQTAIDLLYERRDLPTFSRRWHSGYVFEAFPRTLQSMVNNDSFIRCDFPLGTPLDPETTVNRLMGESVDEWSDHWWQYHTLREVQLPSYRPSWFTTQ